MRLEERVEAELRSLRRSAAGLTVGGLSDCPVITGLLGEGDPAVAYNKLKHRVLGTNGDTALQAVAASLGLTSDKRTHLDRLQEYGDRHGYEQRQVRRYSDRGLRQLGRLITQSWSPELSPRLDLHCYQTGPDTFALLLVARRPEFVEMRNIQTTILSGTDQSSELKLSTTESSEEFWIVSRSIEPIELSVQGETSVVLTWRGELFPKFSVSTRTDFKGFGIIYESLGNRAMLRLLSANGPESGSEVHETSIGNRC